MDSVKRFKGLESPVVVVVLDENFLASEEMLYVAFSGARSLLAVMGTREGMGRIRDTGIKLRDLGTTVIPRCKLR
ncbi:MAG: hypothetical protein APR53_06240 [Methanoculleus sp. SDB]|nr:MAG: hypothetical protein APR53_06240 [Methanoculleus sp. SDB]